MKSFFVEFIRKIWQYFTAEDIDRRISFLPFHMMIATLILCDAIIAIYVITSLWQIRGCTP